MCIFHHYACVCIYFYMYVYRLCDVCDIYSLYIIIYLDYSEVAEINPNLHYIQTVHGKREFAIVDYVAINHVKFGQSYMLDQRSDDYLRG